MEVRYRRELNESFLILEEVEEGDGYTSRILSENRVPGLLAMGIRQLNGHMEYHYEISGKQSLKRLLEKRQITCDEIRNLLYGIRRALESMEEYLLDVENVILEPEFIYISSDMSQVFLCCHPGYREDFFEGLRGMTRYFLNKIDHMEENSVEVAYELFQVSSKDSFGFDELLQAMEDCLEEVPEPEPVSLPWTPEPEDDKPEKNEELPVHLLQVKKKPILSIVVPIIGILITIVFYYSGGLRDYSPTARMVLMILAVIFFILAGMIIRHREQESGQRSDIPVSCIPESRGDEATAPLEGSYQALPRSRLLISQNSLRYETITMRKMPFTIGKLESACDEALNSPVISRIHARVEQREDGFYLTDCSSTNGTFINGARLSANRPYLVKEGDEVAFADLKYIFQ